ncbi:MAG: class I SAM-dependent methyltransferase [Desulfomonilaceae bacterium]
MGDKSWQLGAPGTLTYRLYDALRNQLNGKLVGYLQGRAINRGKCKVLEAGSGPAFASSILARDDRVELCVAVDLDIDALYEARHRDPGLCLVVADVRDLPFKSESLDLSWNSSTVEHLSKPSDAVFEMARVTRKGGHVFVGVPNLYGPLGFEHWIRKTSVGIWIGQTFTGSQLKTMLIQSGLKPQHSLFYFFRFFVGVLAEK